MKKIALLLMVLIIGLLNTACATLEQLELACRQPGILVFGSRVPMDLDEYCW